MEIPVRPKLNSLSKPHPSEANSSTGKGWQLRGRRWGRRPHLGRDALMVMLNPKELDAMVELQAPSRWWWPVIFRGKIFVSSAHTTIPHSLSEDGQLPALDGARPRATSAESGESVWTSCPCLADFSGRSLMAELHPTSSQVGVPGAPACREAAPASVHPTLRQAQGQSS